MRYLEWMEGHRKSCELNFEGSSPAMECEGVLSIWNRSVETRHLRYTQMISDGDCKSFATFNEHKPYGNVEVVKHECVGHVQKRVMPKVKLARTSFKSDKAKTKKKKALKDRMKKCLLGATQNCNESFNSLVWLRAPKTRVLLSRHHEGFSRSGRYCLKQWQAGLGEARGPTSHPSRPTLFLLLGLS